MCTDVPRRKVRISVESYGENAVHTLVIFNEPPFHHQLSLRLVVRQRVICGHQADRWRLRVVCFTRLLLQRLEQKGSARYGQPRIWGRTHIWCMVGQQEREGGMR